MHRFRSKAALFYLTSVVIIVTGTGLVLSPVTSALNQTLASKLSEKSRRLSQEQIARHLSYLASERLQGRRAGTSGADEAARYIASEFKRYGLESPNSIPGFLQAFSFVARVELGQNNGLRIKSRLQNRSLKTGHDFVPLAFSSPEPVSGEVIFAAYGISAPELNYDNYASSDVAGRIVLVLRGSPDGDNPHGRFAEYSAPGLEIQKKTIRAREKGARAILFISSEQDLTEDRLSRIPYDLNFLDGGIPAAVVSRAVADSILSEAGLSANRAETGARQNASSAPITDLSIELRTDVRKLDGTAANVVGVLRGADSNLSSEYIVVGAHYDHIGLGGPESLAHGGAAAIHYGADDNASGTAALLELARVMSLNKDSLRRSVVFIAFGAEELGLLGSAAYTRDPVAPLRSTVAMLNMDMIGRLRDGSLFVGGVGTSPAWKPLLDQLNLAGNSAAGDSAVGRFRISEGQDGFGASDHQSFYIKNIPVLFFFTGVHEDYHKPTDTVDRVNKEGIAEIGELVREIAASVANREDRIAFNRVSTGSRPTGRGFRVYLGTVPSYADQENGLKLDGVRPGSPAEQAGLLPGDVVVNLGGMDIKNVYDYTYALGELKPDQEIEVVIRRGGQQRTLKIRPARRQ